MKARPIALMSYSNGEVFPYRSEGPGETAERRMSQRQEYSWKMQIAQSDLRIKQKPLSCWRLFPTLSVSNLIRKSMGQLKVTAWSTPPFMCKMTGYNGT